MEAVAILVGVGGVAATVSAQTLARTKEFGMLRHLGVLKREIAAMLTIEGLLLGVLGALAGLGLGVIISQCPDPGDQPAVLPLDHADAVALRPARPHMARQRWSPPPGARR